MVKRIGSANEAARRLFIDLYAYRERENRSPLEDWLTECLAATIRALPDAPKAELLGYLADTKIADPPSFFAEHKVDVRTQYVTADAGRPDLLVLLDDCPWILFENKVAHGVSVREDGQGGDVHQLRRYGDWLIAHGGECPLPRALIFVTHITPPPSDFLDDRAETLYPGLRRLHLAWGNLARLIAGLTTALSDDHHARVVADAFLACLEDQNMTHEFPASGAFAAAELYVSQAGSLEYLVDRMWDQVRNIVKFGSTVDYKLMAVPGELSISAWRYLSATSTSIGDCFIQTGIWFPEAGPWLASHELDRELKGPQAFVYFGSDWTDAFADVTTQPEACLRPASEFLISKAIGEFAAEPQLRGEAIVAWAGQQARILIEFLKQQGVVK